VLTSARHLLQLISDVLDLSKVEAGKLELWPETLNLPAVVGEVLTILRVAAAAKRIRVESEIDHSLAEVTLDPAPAETGPVQLRVERAQVYPPRAGGW